MNDDSAFIDNELRISCADAVELVTEYLEASLDRADLEVFETHLSLCEGCQAFLDQIEMTVRLTSASRDTTIDLEPSNMQALLAALDDQAAGRGDAPEGI